MSDNAWDLIVALSMPVTLIILSAYVLIVVLA